MIAIVDYRAGNLTSVKLACEYLGIAAGITSDPQVICSAERVIFPGVGAAASAMENIRELKLEAPLRQVIAQGTPFLGICLGTQIIFQHSEEDGGVPCLGFLDGDVLEFRPQQADCKIPHMGWNTVAWRRAHPIFQGIETGSEFYFVHSYYPAPAKPEEIWAETEYADVTFSAVVGRDNLIATQFHPEKSGRIGLQILKNFSKWDGSC